MNGKTLFEGMSNIEDRFVEEAENDVISAPHPIPWARIAAMAACFCLLVTSFLILNPHDPWLTPAHSESADPTGVSDPPAETEWKSDHTAPASIPAQPPAAEVPSVILRVDRMTEDGFIGTVAELVDTDILELGMELRVVYAADTGLDIAMEQDSEFKSDREDRVADHTGTYVIVQFIHYDRQTNTLTINLMEPKG